MEKREQEELILKDQLQMWVVQTVATSSVLGASGELALSSIHIENIAATTPPRSSCCNMLISHLGTERSFLRAS
jgi:hypothetical protein